MSYQFKAALVTPNKNKYMKVCVAGIAISFLSIPAFIIFREPLLIGLLFILGFLVLIVGVVLAKGDIAAYKIEKDQFFIFDEKYIKIGLVVYPLTDINALNFYYHSYNNQSPGGYYTEHTGQVLYGIGNNVKFIYKGMIVTTDFFLPNKNKADAFFEILAYFKREGIKFGLEIRQSYK